MCAFTLALACAYARSQLGSIALSRKQTTRWRTSAPASVGPFACASANFITHAFLRPCRMRSARRRRPAWLKTRLLAHFFRPTPGRPCRRRRRRSLVPLCDVRANNGAAVSVPEIALRALPPCLCSPVVVVVVLVLVLCKGAGFGWEGLASKQWIWKASSECRLAERKKKIFSLVVHDLGQTTVVHLRANNYSSCWRAASNWLAERGAAAASGLALGGSLRPTLKHAAQLPDDSLAGEKQCNQGLSSSDDDDDHGAAAPTAQWVINDVGL